MRIKYNSNSSEKFISCSGGISFRILLILVTLILIGCSLFLLLENQKKKNKIFHRKAIELSDLGIQQIMENISDKLNSDPSQIQSIPKTEYGEGWYKVEVSATRKDSILSLIIKSEGNVESQSAMRKESIYLKRSVVNGDSVWDSFEMK